VDDAAALHAVYSDDDAMRYWDTPPHATLDDTRACIERELSPDAACWWALSLDAAGPALGVVGYLGNPDVPGMGYILHPHYWRQGYMSEAVRAALDYGFTALGLDRVELWINDDNLPSQRLAASLGFALRGRFRQRYHHHAHAHEKLVYGLHVSEWRDGALATPAHTPPNSVYSLQPILAVPDVQAAAAFYRDQLEFTVDWTYGDPPTHGSVSLGEWTTQAARIQLSHTDEPFDAATAVALYIFVGPDIDARYARYQERGVTIARELATQPWGMREFAVRDRNGYLLRFGTPG
jgi:RimJ/RimL family protein N-acetyltransferase/uncharacterized glyoxalase superfamily protein PhnB